MVELYKEILMEAVANQTLKITFENLKIENANEIVENSCFQTIQAIRAVLNNPELDDFACIEEIVVLLEKMGADGGSRHDFG